MILMEGQLSHIGFEARCLLLSALLAVDDEADDEDMNWRERACSKMKRKVEDAERDK